MFPDEARLGNVGDFFEAPVVNRSWKTETTDPQLVRVDDWLASLFPSANLGVMVFPGQNSLWRHRG